MCGGAPGADHISQPEAETCDERTPVQGALLGLVAGQTAHCLLLAGIDVFYMLFVHL